ncbi:MAG: biopolymer transporter ExbD [Gammaproteobacteria bacterium]|nr:MAG: biopolymer transporter ExbD [Gammaproteobacteria bacterium]
MNFRSPREKEDPDITLTPLIDVVFLLLIFFMVSTTFVRRAELQVELPKATAEGAVKEKALEVLIDAQGRYSIEGRPLPAADVSTLKAAIKEAMGKGKRPLVISADAQTPHQAVVTALDAARQLGITRLSIATRRN